MREKRAVDEIRPVRIQTDYFDYADGSAFIETGRTQEIQRLIGRSLRAVMDLEVLGERTIIVDCDVIQADGGTRVASVTAGRVGLALALQKLLDEREIDKMHPRHLVAGISIGVVGGQQRLDLI